MAEYKVVFLLCLVYLYQDVNALSFKYKNWIANYKRTKYGNELVNVMVQDRKDFHGSDRIVADKLPDVNRTPLSFASYYGDHMVLQQEPKKSTIWGYADASLIGKKISLTIAGNQMTKSYDAPIGKGPRDLTVWSVVLEPVRAGGPYKISVTMDTETITLSDVLFGDVWVCSGQSNMQFTVPQMFNASDEEMKADNYPTIRLFTAAEETSDVPLYDLKSVEQKWSVASKASVGGGAWGYFSAVCWEYGRLIQDQLGYPIGLIATTWGGTPVEAWSSPDSLKKCGIETDVSPNQEEPHYNLNEDEWQDDNLGMASPSAHSVLYNAMIHPFLNLTIYGAIWYQGEANAGAPASYKCTFPGMIDDWREKWYTATEKATDETFPFGFVQIGPYRKYAQAKSIVGGYPVIRWHQTADMGYVPNTNMPNTFMATAVDLTDDDSPWQSIHPRDKLTVGRRLSLAGLAVAYKHKHVRFLGPQCTEYFIVKDQCTITLMYDSGTQDMVVRGKDGFELATNAKYSKGKDIIFGFPDIRWHQTADMGYVPNGVMRNVFMGSAVDLTDDSSPYGGVHPRDKLTTSQRLAYAGMAVAYGRSDVRYQAPQISAFFIDIGFFTLKMEFDNGKSDIVVKSKDGFEVCCQHDNTTTCPMDSNVWTPVPISDSDANSVTLSYNKCANMYIMGIRYIWRETPCEYKKCAVYSVDNDLPLTPFIIDGLIGP